MLLSTFYTQRAALVVDFHPCTVQGWDKNRSCLSQYVGVRPGESPGSAVQVSAPRDLGVWADREHGEPAEQHRHDPEEDTGQWSAV